jgi:hypothetical protein
VLGHFLIAGEPLTARTAVATLSGIAGVAVIEMPALARAGSLPAGSLALGGLLVLVSAVVSAISAVIVKKRLARVSAIVSVWGQSLVAALVLLGAATVREGTASRWTPGRSSRSAISPSSGRSRSWGASGSFPGCPWRSWGPSDPEHSPRAALGSLLGHERITARAVAGGADPDRHRDRDSPERAAAAPAAAG